MKKSSINQKIYFSIIILILGISSFYFSLTSLNSKASVTEPADVNSLEAAYIRFTLTNGEKVEGESLDSTFEGDTDISLINFILEKPYGIGTQLRREALIIPFYPIELVKELDSSTPSILENYGSGGTFKDVAIFVTASYSGQDLARQVFLIIVLEEASVVSYQIVADGQEPPLESFSLFYKRIYIEYHKRNQDGSLLDTIGWGWDLQMEKTWETDTTKYFDG
ncbi:MAG: type VI secretion system tube protein Hcp [Candidatus Hodarchaeales archaeon]|jgi:type VI protein secretion system component Hcp